MTTAASVMRAPHLCGEVEAVAGVIRIGQEQVRTGPWRGDGTVAYLAPTPQQPVPSADFLRRCLDLLAQRGFTRVITGALSPFEQSGFLAAGFEVTERLHLLAHDLSALPEPRNPPVAIRRARARDRAAVLTVDHLAFPPFWQLDDRGLTDAIEATPRTRFRLAERHPTVRAGPSGYAVCGRAGRRGYVQRLAVHPAVQGCGIGRALMVDGLHWLRRRGVDRAIVNTQVDNVVALRLYESLGFLREPVGLSVLSTGTVR